MDNWKRRIAIIVICCIASVLHVGSYTYRQQCIRVGGPDSLPDGVVLWWTSTYMPDRSDDALLSRVRREAAHCWPPAECVEMLSSAVPGDQLVWHVYLRAEGPSSFALGAVLPLVLLGSAVGIALMRQRPSNQASAAIA